MWRVSQCVWICRCHPLFSLLPNLLSVLWNINHNFKKVDALFELVLARFRFFVSQVITDRENPLHAYDLHIPIVGYYKQGLQLFFEVIYIFIVYSGLKLYLKF